MSYTKKVWSDRIVQKPLTYQMVDNGNGTFTLIPAPGTITQAGTPVSAASLNNLETQYDQAVAYCKELIGRNTYDDYLRTLELYYTGHFTGPGIEGMKGMTFDGFQDTSRVNTGNTTAEVLTNLKLARCGGSISYQVGVSSNVGATNNTGLSDAGTGQTYNDFANITNMDDVNDSTFAEASLSGEVRYSLVSLHDLNSIKLLKSIKMKAVCSGAGNGWIRKISYSTDGVNFTVIDIADIMISWNPDSADAWKEITFETAINARYFAIEWYFTSQSGSYSALKVYTVNAGIYTYSTSLLYSTQKNLSMNPISAKLYISAKMPLNSNVIPTLSVNGGTNYEALTLISSRADPLDSAYTEKEYEVNFANVGSAMIFKVSLIPDSTNKQTPEIKRYGLHWA